MYNAISSQRLTLHKRITFFLLAHCRVFLMHPALMTRQDHYRSQTRSNKRVYGMAQQRLTWIDMSRIAVPSIWCPQ